MYKYQSIIICRAMYNVVECTIITICAVSRKKTIKQKFVMTVGIEPPTPGFKVSCTAPTLFWIDCRTTRNCPSLSTRNHPI